MRELPTGTVTLLFTDIEGSTRLLHLLGKRYADVLAEFRDLLRTAFQQYHGHEVDTQGDAFFVAFARASDAVMAAVAMQRSLASHVWPEGVTVRVRMGLHTGEPERSTEGYVGLDVHRAARIMSAGHGGQVLLSQVTRDLVEQSLQADISLQDLGEHRLKDLERPQRLLQLVISNLQADFPPLKTLDALPNNLPIQPTPFIGREKEVATVTQWLRQPDVRLLTLTGAGGMGKTRLALQGAAELVEQFADGVFLVALAPVSDAELVMSMVIQTLSLTEAGGQTPLDFLKIAFKDKQMLLLLDNFEQVIEAAIQVAELLAACPRLKLMITSRVVLHVQAEREFTVPPLSLPDPKRLPDLLALSQYEAVALFIQRAQAVKPEFSVTTANAPAVTAICAQLDGLPLAIELAAARSKLLSPQALLSRLSQRLQLLTGGARDAPARQQTLRSTIQWSYQLLDADEQRLFRRLAIFVGGCTLEAIEAVCAALDSKVTALPVLDGVASLIDKSLLRQTEQEEREARLLMLETIREYGLECLVVCGEMESARQVHAQYYLRLAEQAESELKGPEQAAWLQQLEREHENLRAAMVWLLEPEGTEHRSDIALRFVIALRRFWLMRGYWSEGRTFLEQALTRSEGGVTSVRATVLEHAAEWAYLLDDYERGAALCKGSLALFRALGDKAGIASCLYMLAGGGQDWWGEARTRSTLAEAQALIEEALALHRELGDMWGIAHDLFSLAQLLSHQGEYARARARLQEYLELERAFGNAKGMSDALMWLARVDFLAQGDAVQVGALLEESLQLLQEVGDKWSQAFYCYVAGQVALQQGDAAAAQGLAEESVLLYREMGHRQGVTWTLSALADVEVRQGNQQAARALYEESLAVAKAIGDTWAITSCFVGLARLVASQGELIWAARLWGTAEALREGLGTPLPPVYRADYERAVAAARTQLGEQAFATAWAEGRTMTLEQAVNEALKWDGGAGRQEK
jgi:predicted ATPase/class 3 adenylate cyclase